MSKSGEIADNILELLSNVKTMRKKELKRKLSPGDTRILSFLEEFGLIETDIDYIRITQSGEELLTVG